jgi:23S rRNA pseudouridine2605 synthase
LRRGIRLDDGVRTAPAQVTKLDETGTNAWFEFVLHEGRNQQIRRMFDAIGHSVLKLRRTRIGAITDEGLKPGTWRHLTLAEVAKLKRKATPRKGERKAAKTHAAGHVRTRS